MGRLLPSVITRVLMRSRKVREGKTDRLEDATSLALKMEDGVTSQGI